MPQVKIHISSKVDSKEKIKLVRRVRDALIESLHINENIGQVILYETPTHHRNVHKSRDINFVLIEITMYPGRSKEKKEKLAMNLINIASEFTGVSEDDINLIIYEIPPENYFGGISHPYIDRLAKK